MLLGLCGCSNDIERRKQSAAADGVVVMAVGSEVDENHHVEL